VVLAAGTIDFLVANRAFTAPTTTAKEVSEAEWRQVFAALADPLPRLVRAAIPAMVPVATVTHVRVRPATLNLPEP
jgi:2-keto-3-deoxy-L-fuconate dehydrogenase